MKRKTTIRGVPADDELRQRVRDVVARMGDKEAARAIGIGRATVSRILAELPVAPGTFALVREYLAKATAEAAE